VKVRSLELKNLIGKLIIKNMNDYISDLLARLQNGIMRKKKSIQVPDTKMIRIILEILEQEKMIGSFEEIENNGLEVHPLYTEDNEPVVSHFKRVSKPGQRIYVSHIDIVPVKNGRGINIVSTSSGVMTGAMAKSQNLGGELICEIW
jgi:small subunit ribosomal protein S8